MATSRQLVHPLQGMSTKIISSETAAHTTETNRNDNGITLTLWIFCVSFPCNASNPMRFMTASTATIKTPVASAKKMPTVPGNLNPVEVSEQRSPSRMNGKTACAAHFLSPMHISSKNKPSKTSSSKMIMAPLRFG